MILSLSHVITFIGGGREITGGPLALLCPDVCVCSREGVTGGPIVLLDPGVGRWRGVTDGPIVILGPGVGRWRGSGGGMTDGPIVPPVRGFGSVTGGPIFLHALA